MVMKKRSLSAPPVEWVDHLEKHAFDVRRLRMLWRRGRAAYRPLVPLGTDLEELEAQPDSEWDLLELPETNLEWVLDHCDEPERREWSQATVDELWEIARAWTRQSGPCCDFQLIGYGADGAILFEDARRCRTQPPQARVRPSAPVGATHRPAREPGVTVVGVDYEAINDLEGRKDRFIDRLAGDRDWSFNSAQQAMTSAQQAMSAAPTVLEQVGDILQRSIAYQQDVVTQLQDQSTDSCDAQKHTVTEQEQTRRMEIRAKMWSHFFDNTLTVAVPLASSVIGWVTNRRVNVMPNFEKAQEAMMYICYSISPTRLRRMCKDNEQAAGSFLAALEDGAKFQSEKDALYYISDLVMLFRCELFEDNATMEERLAARYIIGRYAMYKANDTQTETRI